MATKEIPLSINPVVGRICERWNIFQRRTQLNWAAITQPRVVTKRDYLLGDYYHDWIFGVGIYSNNNPWHDISYLARNLKSGLWRK